MLLTLATTADPSNFIGIMLAAVATVLSTALVGVIRMLLRKWGLDLDAKQTLVVEDIVQMGIARAAQAAKLAAKGDGSPAAKLSSEEKKRIALEFAEQLARARKVPETHIAMFGELIEATLAGIANKSPTATT